MAKHENVRENNIHTRINLYTPFLTWENDIVRIRREFISTLYVKWQYKISAALFVYLKQIICSCKIQLRVEDTWTLPWLRQEPCMLNLLTILEILSAWHVQYVVLISTLMVSYYANVLFVVLYSSSIHCIRFTYSLCNIAFNRTWKKLVGYTNCRHFKLNN